MEFQERVIDEKLYSVLILRVLEEEDRMEIPGTSDSRHLQVELSQLELLSQFPAVESLIVTGGIPSPDGLRALYGHEELKRLVLDYEETDSDEDGIDLSFLPELEYVLSRSNLNIRGSAPQARVTILNQYRDGRPVKVKYPPAYDLFRKRSFLFFSPITAGAAGMLLGRILTPAEKVFTDRHFGERFSDDLDSFGIIPICMPLGMQGEYEGWERRLVSRKGRYADVRLQMDYRELTTTDEAGRFAMCFRMIEAAADYVAHRDKTFQKGRFLDAVAEALRQVWRQR